MDKTARYFDKWATIGRSEEMEIGHGNNVNKFLDNIAFDKTFTFLDIGCGNGWVVRKISQIPNCKQAIGIDKSKNMIEKAKMKRTSKKEKYFQAELESWKNTVKFDVVFSMESLYYSVPMEPALAKVYTILKPDGVFYCGTDFYSDNHLTTRWAKDMKIPMDLRSKSQWKKMFEKLGFTTRTKQVKDLTHKSKWKREYGTLFVIGEKQKID